MRRPAVVGAVVLCGWAAGCGSGDASSSSAQDPIGHAVEPIQGGANDVSHEFAVAVLQVVGQNLAICSGVLLAPNLVATARHCVSQLASTRIDCSTSSFISTLPASDMFVTTTPNIATANMRTDFISVIGGASGTDGIIVPPLPGVCGNDLALLILSQSIDLPQYVTPIIAPPMTDHQIYTTAFTAIGYGVDSPTDTTGSTAGIRRIREDINIACIPNDPSDNCYSDPSVSQFIAPGEFEGGDGTCEGDSGSGAFDQGSYNSGVWAAFGVLSRGGVSAEGGTCQGSIYTRFDAWGSLIVDAANKAAALGGYAPPAWTNPSAPPAADASTSVGIPPATCTQNDAVCGQDSDCCAFNCIISSDHVTAYCRACDPTNNCSSGYGCQEGVCVFGAANNYGPATATVGVKSGGCSVGSAPGSSGFPGFPGEAATFGLVVAGAGMTRRRRKTRRSSCDRAA